MTKVVYKKLAGTTAHEITSRAATALHTTSIATKSKKKSSSISANVVTFGDELTVAFGRNVTAARRANKKTFGMNDRVPVKA
jgi:hypothetical protein